MGYPIFQQIQDMAAGEGRPLWPCGYDNPRPDRDPDLGPVVVFGDMKMTRDEAIAIGFAILETALALPEDDQ